MMSKVILALFILLNSVFALVSGNLVLETVGIAGLQLTLAVLFVVLGFRFWNVCRASPSVMGAH